MNHYLKVKKTAKYCTLGQLSEETETIWWVLHGYGQLANFFIKKFEVLNNGKNFIIAPEGLHRFYVQGFSGRVGASWMTKEEREKDIEDYLNYLNQLYHQFNFSNKRIVVLGFSQGAATACRWVADGKITYHHLVLYAGVFPPDFPFEAQKFSSNPILVHGEKDEFINTATFQNHIDFLISNNISPNIIKHKENHNIYPSVLKQINNIIQQ